MSAEFIILMVAQIGHVAVTAALISHVRRSAKSPTSTHLCSCKHEFNYHDPATGVCAEQVSRVVTNEGRRWFPCTCKRFVGNLPPDLIVDQFQPGISERLRREP